MLAADHFKHHVYEYRGVDVEVIPARCCEIGLATARVLFSEGYELIDLSLFCVYDNGEVFQWNILSRNQALDLARQRHGGSGELTRDVINYLPHIEKRKSDV